MSKKKKPQRIEISLEEVEALITRGQEGALKSEDFDLIRSMAETLWLLSESVDQKSQSIKKLVGMLFGPQSERANNILPTENSQSEQKVELFPDDSEPKKRKPKKRSSGKRSASEYTGAEVVECKCEDLKHRDRCPKCGKGKVYSYDATTRRENMDDQQRLSFHQAHSQQIMSDLKQWMKSKFKAKEVEPNSGLGQAFNYAVNRWDALTLFLRRPGVPLDNNICERALKKSILTRKNSLFFKTQRGAQIGDIYMSIIHTCELAKVNGFKYLHTILDYKKLVAMAPEKWMPWNFEATLDQIR